MNDIPELELRVQLILDKLSSALGSGLLRTDKAAVAAIAAELVALLSTPTTN